MPTCRMAAASCGRCSRASRSIRRPARSRSTRTATPSPTYFLTEVAQNTDGTLYNKLIKTIPQVNQTLGIPEADFLKLGPVGRDNPSCP